MAYTITATLTFSSQANRDAARTRLDTALAAYSYSNMTTMFTAGITNPSTTTMTISIKLDAVSNDQAKAAYESMLAALTASNRHTSGWIGIINR